MLGQLDPQASADLVTRMADFTMLLDSSGCILELSVNNEDLAGAVDDSWIGQVLRDLATAESRPRVDELLEQVSTSPGTVASCDASHEVEGDSELLVRYRAVARDGTGILVLGQDMRPEANLRQQLMNAQQALEQDYWRLRQIETRYKRLFDMVSDAIIVVDGDSQRVIESNPRAAALLAPDQDSIAGKPFPLGLDKTGQRSIKAFLDEVRIAGRGSLEEVHSEGGGHCFDVFATFLRQGSEARFLVRLAEHGADGASADHGADALLSASSQASPDAILLTDEDGRIVAANQAFLELAQVVSQDQVLGQLADRWLGRSGVDLSVLLTNLRKNASVKLFSTTLQGEQGSTADVEVSAIALTNARGKHLAFFIRDVGRRVMKEHPSVAQLPRSIEQITKRVGRVPLKDLVRESTDVIEALCIEAALSLTHDNRASAAELLGLSRQSLYAKLRRYEIDGPGDEAG